MMREEWMFFIRRFTARNHITNLQRKLGARNRVEAVRLATVRRLI